MSIDTCWRIGAKKCRMRMKKQSIQPYWEVEHIKIQKKAFIIEIRSKKKKVITKRKPETEKIETPKKTGTKKQKIELETTVKTAQTLTKMTETKLNPKNTHLKKILTNVKKRQFKSRKNL